MILFDFDSEASSRAWISINDVVMGGVSHSRFDYVGESTAAFSGTVSLKHSGGFASVRSTPMAHDLRGHSGLLLRVRGDGKQYKMNLNTEAALGRKVRSEWISTGSARIHSLHHLYISWSPFRRSLLTGASLRAHVARPGMPRARNDHRRMTRLRVSTEDPALPS
jgi:hypothetical protein